MIELLRKEMSLFFLTVTLAFFLMFLAAIGLGGLFILSYQQVIEEIH